MMKVYKSVKWRELHDENPIELFNAMLNEEAEKGWELHSVVPQVYEGSVDNNVVIFVQEYEE